ncbi:beta-lactamase [Kineothrix alysoides]|uniref:Beta-lactamase n=1 Tax=Kineothrix alysoides TaxID=1469948 RepID=A0A4R1R0Q6_9FIRM|nr:serine hydrolase [Kineothrix alysoides]TCL58872.1 beta-lactamase [Kineothrix alysoides]
MKKELFNKVVNEMNNMLDKNGKHLDMVSLIISCGGEHYQHFFKEEEKVDIRSIAKPILCLAVGAAIEEGLYFGNIKIGLETPIWQFVSQYAKISHPEQEEKWNQIRLIDLFRITLGHGKGIMFSADVKMQDEDNLVNYVVNYPITERIGSHFVYSNAGTFIISTLITEYLGESAEYFVDKYIFSKLNIEDYTWKKFGKYTAGCTGLKLLNKDLHKIGLLIYNNGVYDGKHIVSKEWIEKMRTPQVAHPTHRYIAERSFPKWSYGLNLWICEDGTYYCDGTDGQYLIIIPQKEIVITTTGYQSDTQPVSDCLGLFK